MEIILLSIALTMLSVFLAYYLATARGVDPKFWVIMAILFGVLALPFIFLAKENTKRNETKVKENYLRA